MKNSGGHDIPSTKATVTTGNSAEGVHASRTSLLGTANDVSYWRESVTRRSNASKVLLLGVFLAVVVLGLYPQALWKNFALGYGPAHFNAQTTTIVFIVTVVGWSVWISFTTIYKLIGTSKNRHKLKDEYASCTGVSYLPSTLGIKSLWDEEEPRSTARPFFRLLAHAVNSASSPLGKIVDSSDLGGYGSSGAQQSGDLLSTYTQYSMNGGLGELCRRTTSALSKCANIPAMLFLALLNFATHVHASPIHRSDLADESALSFQYLVVTGILAFGLGNASSFVGQQSLPKKVMMSIFLLLVGVIACSGVNDSNGGWSPSVVVAVFCIFLGVVRSEPRPPPPQDSCPNCRDPNCDGNCQGSAGSNGNPD